MTRKEALLKFKEIKHALSFISAQYDDLIANHNRIIQDNEELNKHVKDLQVAQQQGQDEIDVLKHEFNKIQQQKMQNKIVVFGAPIAKDNTELKEIIMKISTNMQIQEEVNIVDIYQPKQNNNTNQSQNNNNTAPIYVELNNAAIKTTIVKLSKAKKINTNDLGYNHKTKIVIADRMTPHSQMLFNAAKNLRNNGFKFIWYKEGEIFARRNETSRIILIKSLTQINTLNINMPLN